MYVVNIYYIINREPVTVLKAACICIVCTYMGLQEVKRLLIYSLDFIICLINQHVYKYVCTI